MPVPPETEMPVTGPVPVLIETQPACCGLGFPLTKFCCSVAKFDVALIKFWFKLFKFC